MMSNSPSCDPKKLNASNAPRCRSCGGGVVAGVVLALLGLGLFAAGSLTGPGDSDRSVTVPVPASTTSRNEPDAKWTGAVWRESFDAALSEAAAADRPILLRFTADWCLPCQVMDKSVFSKENVKAALAEHVIPVKIDIDHGASQVIAQRYGVRGIPTLVLVDSEGNELARGGFMSAEILVEFLQKT